MPNDDRPAEEAPKRGSSRVWLALVLLAIASSWIYVSTGLISSNDGSHVALARALVLRGETTIDPEVGLTLLVDRAKRDDHYYSDRPPGTAFLALGAVWIGAQIDPALMRSSQESRELVAMPAGTNFANTYAVRAKGQMPLLGLQGTAVAIAIHCALVGVLGLWCVVVLLRRAGVGIRGRMFAVLTLGLATLWGPYSTMLFSHVTAGTMLIAMVLLLDLDREHGRPWLAALAGLAGGWAVATDYLLVLAVVPIVLACAPVRRWPWIAAGVVPIAWATAAYHHAAFGSIWSVGYDFQTNFAFARSRAATFSGNPAEGLWTLWGLGRTAGVLALAPIVFAGVFGLALDRRRRVLVALVPWILALSFHHTPFGGGTSDHRYLIPMFPVVGVGLGLAWDRFVTQVSGRRWIGAAIIVAVAVVSAARVWLHFMGWRG